MKAAIAILVLVVSVGALTGYFVAVHGRPQQEVRNGQLVVGMSALGAIECVSAEKNLSVIKKADFEYEVLDQRQHVFVTVDFAPTVQGGTVIARLAGFVDIGCPEVLEAVKGVRPEAFEFRLSDKIPAGQRVGYWAASRLDAAAAGAGLTHPVDEADLEKQPVVEQLAGQIIAKVGPAVKTTGLKFVSVMLDTPQDDLHDGVSPLQLKRKDGVIRDLPLSSRPIAKL